MTPLSMLWLPPAGAQHFFGQASASACVKSDMRWRVRAESWRKNSSLTLKPLRALFSLAGEDKTTAGRPVCAWTRKLASWAQGCGCHSSTEEALPLCASSCKRVPGFGVVKRSLPKVTRTFSVGVGRCKWTVVQSGERFEERVNVLAFRFLVGQMMMMMKKKLLPSSQ